MLAICANTMHINSDDVIGAVTVPVIDVRDAVASEARRAGSTSLATSARNT